MRNLRHNIKTFTALCVLVTFYTGCGGETNFQPASLGGATLTDSTAVITERQLGTTDSPVSSTRLVVLRLEPSGTDHGFDRDEPGVDRLKVEFSALGIKEVSLETGDYQANLLDPSGNVILQLGPTRLSGQAAVGRGTYTWEFRNPGTETVLVFARGEGVVLSKNAPGADLSLLDFSGENLSGRDFRRAVMRGTSFMEAECTGANFSGCDLTDALFSLANCDGANFEGAVLTDTHSYSASFQGASFSQSARRTQSSVRAQSFFPGTIAVASAANIVVTPSRPLIISAAGGPVTANYGVITIEDGGVIQVGADLSLQAQELQLNGAAQIRFVGSNGATGRAGEPGRAGRTITLFGESMPEGEAIPGGAGAPGGDGENTSTAILRFESVSGSGHLSVTVKPGQGGAGGKGGDGATWIGAPSNGGLGGPGGRGGDAENVYIYTSSDATGYFSGDTNPGQGGEGGMGGTAGTGSGGFAEDGEPGEAGLPGNAGSFVIRATQ